LVERVEQALARAGRNASTTIAAVKRKLAELAASLPDGVEIVTVYDRSQLIERAIDNLKTKLGAEVWWVEAGARIQRRATDTHASEPTRDRLIGFCKGEILNTTDVKDLPARLATIFTSP
jgi:hypothetical protein